MPTHVNDYANFVADKIEKSQSRSLKVSIERQSRTRLLLSIEDEGQLHRFRVLMFAVGGTGRGNADERRIEITSTYTSGLSRDPAIVDIVLGIERDRELLVGIDAGRLKHGGPTSNASTFVYSTGFDSLKSKTYDALINPSKLISDEHQIYMRPSFLMDYLLNVQSLHRLGLMTSGTSGTTVPKSQIVSPDDPTEPGKATKLTFEQQMRLAMLKIEVGQLGERTVVARERRRLNSDGQPNLAVRVHWVSQTHPYVGYDISSFAQTGTREVVEVKSSTGTLKQFHFSNNELRVAERRRASYRIVCVSNVFEKPSFYEIRDPATKLDAGVISKVPDGYIVTL
jgi:hypothetical protein